MTDIEETGLGESRLRAVRAELDQVLESAAFRSTKRCSDFLRYVVEHTITGPNGALKERLIGVELFQLPPDFDPGQHTIVRVTANEIRKKLAQYYLTENGRRHPVRIELPSGSYKAGFMWDVPATETLAPPRLGRLTARNIAYAAVAVFVLVGGFFAGRWREAKAVSSNAWSVSNRVPVPNTAPAGGDVRILVGSTSSYADRSGRIWSPDRFSSGGSVRFRPSERIFRTLDPDIYRRQREGDFRYDIPLRPGSYELHLYFAETGLADFISAESSGEGQRIFHVGVNGRRILELFDVVADSAGANIADERVFRNVTPAEDGILHLSFESARGSPVLSGI